jgi:hypothetical protein
LAPLYPHQPCLISHIVLHLPLQHRTKSENQNPRNTVLQGREEEVGVVSLNTR